MKDNKRFLFVGPFMRIMMMLDRMSLMKLTK